eukprot:6214778-Pleurochrysis_carterae.AAC.5
MTGACPCALRTLLGSMSPPLSSSRSVPPLAFLSPLIVPRCSPSGSTPPSTTPSTPPYALRHTSSTRSSCPRPPHPSMTCRQRQRVPHCPGATLLATDTRAKHVPCAHLPRHP